MIYFAVIGWFLAGCSAVSGLMARRGYIKRLGSKQTVIDILRGELRRIAKERQGELEEISRLRADVKRLTPKRNVHGKFVGRSEEL